jgi:peptide/nickel transport system permease protein
MVGAFIMASLASAAAIAPLIVPHNPLATNYSAILSPPNRTYPLGTDRLGRDLLARVIYGGRISLAVGAGAVIVAMGIGVTVGLVAGYLGGHVDNVLMRLVDTMLIFPGLILAATIALFLGPSLSNVVLAIGLVRWPVFARLVRAQVLTIRERDHVTAAVALGARTTRILIRHVLPDAGTVIIIEGALSAGFAMLTEASLNFLGIGVPPPTPTWGAMLREGYGYLELAPWASFVPGAAIFLGILAFNFAADGLRDATDPTQ